MARLEAQAKLLYYPTPNEVVNIIATWFTAQQPVRLADPCCGTGEALQRLAALACVEVPKSETRRVERRPEPAEGPAETWGVELSYSRAQEAQGRLTAALASDFYEVRYPSRWSPGSVGLMFNNPPYDWSDETDRANGKERRLRHEVLFIEGATPKIQVGGHHIIIVPRPILGSAAMHGLATERTARHLLGWYEGVSVFRFPDPLYEIFSQVILFAANKRARYHPPTAEALQAITDQVDPGYPIPIITPRPEDVPPFVIPAMPAWLPKFICVPHNPQHQVDLARQVNLVGTGEYARANYVRPIGAPFTPALPLAIGHVSMLISGQETGLLKLTDAQGPMLVKGMSRKTVKTSGQDKTDDKGRYAGTSVTEREQHQATLTITRPDGNLQTLATPAEVAGFITANVDPISDAILSKNHPLYNMQPFPWEWERTSRSAQGLPPLPGRQERGLFPVQRHFAIAAGRVMRKYGAAIMNCEMGFGKTATSIATLEVMDKWPALVLCPGHMVWKWKRDIERSSDPANPITARVITKPAAAEPGSWYELKASIEANGGAIVEMRRRQVDPKTPNDPGGRRWVKITTTDKTNAGAIFAALQAQTFKDGDTHQTIRPTVRHLVEGHQLRGYEAEFIDRDDYTLFDFERDYKSGLLGRKTAAVVAFDPAKYDAGDAPERALIPAKRRDPHTGLLQNFSCCPTCGKEILPEKNGWPRFCAACGGALVNFTRWRRIGLARLVQRQFRRFFKVYVADEVHKCKEGRTDIGCADQRFLSAIRYSLALTGTLFGGAAGSLFYLLYRRVPELRRLYAFDERNRWVDHYGLWEREWDQDEPIAAEAGASTGIVRWNYRQRELPGVSPAVVRYLLPITLFGNITDLGYSLPPVHEQVEQLDMPGELAGQYGDIEGRLLRQAIECARENGDIGALSVWFNTARFRPASAFRDELVNWEGKKGGALHLELPQVGALLPKETALTHIVRQAMSQGRKTLVFVEQTGERDIRTHLKESLEELVNDIHQLPGQEIRRRPRIAILSAADMAPARREAWITGTAPNLDVLIVNPKLVETGLDLVMFSNLVFYETTVSLYVLWQAMRRVWRLGQSKAVEVTFLAYRGTMEETILDRMGQKMKFAQLLYGKEAAGVLVENNGEDDIQRELIQAALEGKTFRNAGEMVALGPVLTTGTEKTIQVTSSPLGSPVAASPALPIPAVTVAIIAAADKDLIQLSLIPGFTPLDPAGVNTKKRRR